MSDPLVIGSLKVEVLSTGIARLTLLKEKDGTPVSYLSEDDLKKIVDYVEAENIVEDLL